MSTAVPQAYAHRAKQAQCLGVREAGGGLLKLYLLAPEGAPVPPAMLAATERWLASDAATLLLARERGFVIVHRCGEAFHFLLPSVWREANELWEAVWFSPDGETPFRPFDPAYPPPGAPRPTFCVWELAIVAHEAQAWTRFLQSSRDEAADRAWQADCYSGPA